MGSEDLPQRCFVDQGQMQPTDEMTRNPSPERAPANSPGQSENDERRPGIKRGQKITPSILILKKVMHLFEGLWMDFGMVNRGEVRARVRKGPTLNPSLFHWKCTSETRRDFCFFER